MIGQTQSYDKRQSYGITSSGNKQRSQVGKGNGIKIGINSRYGRNY